MILPEINQVKFPLQSINQVAYQDNVLQRYRANQPYFNRFTGKVGKMLLSPQTATASVPSLTPRQENTSYRHITSDKAQAHRARNRLDFKLKGRIENPYPRQLEHQKFVPFSEFGIIPLSVIKTIPILRSYKGGRLVISRFNSYLWNKLFPFGKPNTLRKRTDGLHFRLEKPVTFRYPTSPFFAKKNQKPVLTNYIVSPFSERNKANNRYISPTNETSSARQILRLSVQTNALANTMSFPYTNGHWFKTGNIPINSAKHSYDQIETRQALINPHSYFKPQVIPVSSIINFQTARETNFRPAMPTPYLAMNAGFQSPLKGFHIRLSRPWREGHETGSNGKGKVVTEGELKEKGLLSNILSRNHIHRKIKVKYGN